MHRGPIEKTRQNVWEENAGHWDYETLVYTNFHFLF